MMNLSSPVSNYYFSEYNIFPMTRIAAGFGEMMVYHLCMNPRHSFQQVAADHPLYLALADIAAANGVAIDIHMEAIQVRAPVSPRLARRCSQNPATLEPTVPALQRLLRHNAKARIVW